MIVNHDRIIPCHDREMPLWIRRVHNRLFNALRVTHKSDSGPSVSGGHGPNQGPLRTLWWFLGVIRLSGRGVMMAWVSYCPYVDIYSRFREMGADGPVPVSSAAGPTILRHVLRVVASLKNMPVAQLAEANARTIRVCYGRQVCSHFLNPGGILGGVLPFKAPRLCCIVLCV